MITILSATNRINSRSFKIASLYKMLLDTKNVESQIISLTELPENSLHTTLYQNTGRNEEFNQLVSRMRISEKFIFVIPEYNGSFPGVLKLFIDGMSYPSPFAGKKGALVGIGSGAMGGALALSHFTDILHYLGMHVLANKVRLARIETLLLDGKISDNFLNGLIENQVRDLISF